jgi:regulator of replication initiation timing
MTEKFLREAKMVIEWSKVSPFIVRGIGFSLPDAGHRDCVLVLEFMQKGTIEQCLCELSVTERVIAILSALLGAQFIHDQGQVHGDIKPSNILVNSAKEFKISDFGAARDADGTTTQLSGVTMTYAAPEVLEEALPTVRSDLYSLGLVILFILTGFHVFDSSKLKTPFKLMRAIGAGVKVDLPGVKPELASFLLSCCAADPERRPASALAVFEVICREKFALGDEVDTLVVRRELSRLGVDPIPFEEKIERVERENVTLRSEVDPLRRELVSLKLEVEPLRERLLASEVECAALKKRIGEGEKESAALKKRVSDGETANSALKKRVSEGEAESSSLKKRVSESEAANSALKSENAALKKRVGESETANSALKKRVGESEAESSSLKKRVAALEAEVRELKTPKGPKFGGSIAEAFGGDIAGWLPAMKKATRLGAWPSDSKANFADFRRVATGQSETLLFAESKNKRALWGAYLKPAWVSNDRYIADGSGDHSGQSRPERQKVPACGPAISRYPHGHAHN